MTRNHLSAFTWRAHYPLVIGALKSRVIIHKVKEKTARGVGKWPFLEEGSASLPGEPPSSPSRCQHSRLVRGVLAALLVCPVGGDKAHSSLWEMGGEAWKPQAVLLPFLQNSLGPAVLGQTHRLPVLF